MAECLERQEPVGGENGRAIVPTPRVLPSGGPLGRGDGDRQGLGEDDLDGVAVLDPLEVVLEVGSARAMPVSVTAPRLARFLARRKEAEWSFHSKALSEARSRARRAVGGVAEFTLWMSRGVGGDR